MPHSRDNLILNFIHKDNPTDSIYLHFSDKTSLSKEDIDVVAKKMGDQQVKRAIFVGRGKLTSICEKHIAFLQSSLHIEYFEEKDLIVNITEHELVPLHVVLNDDEKEELLKR